MKYQLLAVDMDGTVLNSKKKITDRTAEAIRNALDQGYEVVFSTGRNFVEVREYLKQFPGMRYAILCSGAVVKDLRTGRDLKKWGLDFDLANRVLDAAGGMDVSIVPFIGDELYAAERVRGCMDYFNCQCYQELHEACATWVEDPRSVMREHPNDIRKINFFFHDTAEYLRMGDLLDGMGVSHPSGSPCNYEISPFGVSKAAGLQVLCGHLGLSMEQAIACGDEGNDRDMILAAGLGVAMGNAIASIQEIADTVVADCDHDGVAEVIEKYLLGESV